MNTTRRNFCKTVVTAVAGLSLASTIARAAGPKEKRIAAIVVTYGLRTHGDNVVTRLLEGHWINDKYHPPFCEVASVYALHPPKDNRGDLSRRLADSYGFRLSPTIADALTLGTGKLAVDGVVIVSEDGNTTWTKNPFFLFFSQVVEVFQKSGRSVPVYNDKALSHDWSEANWMVRQSRNLGFPMLAGSTLAVTFRRPELEFPLGTRLEEAVAICGLGDPHVESHAFHAFELLQAMVERRAGGETGIRAVQFLEGKAVWEAAERGVWSRAIFDAALARLVNRPQGRPEDLIKQPIALLIEYNDGFRGVLANSEGAGGGYSFAARVQGQAEIQSTQSYYIGENGNSFSCMMNLFERMMASGRPAFPIERTLLTSGALDFLMRSRHEGNRRMETPELLGVTYQPDKESSYFPGVGS